MNYDELSDWARRAAIDLQSYATAAQEAGTPIEITEALIKELDDIRACRPTWQRRYAEKVREQGSMLDAI